MKNKLSIVAALVLVLFVSLGVFAQSSTPKALLWKISGNGLKKPSYLYGTIHVLCNDDFFIPENLKKVLNQTDKLVLEANIADPQLNEKILKIILTNTPLSQQLSPADYKEMDSILLATCKVPLKTFENVQPVVILSLLAQQSLNCPTPDNYEKKLIDLVTLQNKNIDWLEELEDQMNYLIKSYTLEQIVAQIKSTKDLKEGMKDLVRLYKQQDINGLYNALTTPDLMDANTIHWMLEVRNTNWVNKMPGMMKEKSCVFAVGSGHLAGEIGLIQQLKKKGYTVTPVLN
ncbi:TraB/GumN family protein [Chitinophaga silvatica]|uniref:TraB/GumN family protein n=1 Tax=Chitinophaga silvatica TaxID=2282649 RepID=A0A3E1Y8C7_9BACT|nr:TraB/GumN family protein [Chitinophaga silvatica]RFS21416.1 TraB/GumN family protein [Chitinophaga silvatica]